ncbi:hypothetical protein JS531_09050 [Bifidobacterium sp. CP2]|uniref:hypothetical protein n=1 Tax=Bifidobacterium sp. CP2 TaxID=2809025 RepID=UPI001BDD3FE6|nr:hypothetical protein [Bifidobacterium sp. CP2]MBT1182088.1 hypothetical protein [Bifidobacterium sp. CP2]
MKHSIVPLIVTGVGGAAAGLSALIVWLASGGMKAAWHSTPGGPNDWSWLGSTLTDLIGGVFVSFLCSILVLVGLCVAAVGAVWLIVGIIWDIVEARRRRANPTPRRPSPRPRAGSPEADARLRR